MSKKRYRINFVANFDVIIDVPDGREVRLIADRMQGLDWVRRAAAEVNVGRIGWNTISRVGDDAD